MRDIITRHYHRKCWLLCTNRAVNKIQWRPLHKSNEKLIRSDRYVLVIVDVHKKHVKCAMRMNVNPMPHTILYLERVGNLWDLKIALKRLGTITHKMSSQCLLTKHCDFYLQIEYVYK